MRKSYISVWGSEGEFAPQGGGGGGGSIEIVQVKSGNGGGGTGTTLNLTFDQSVTPGNSIIAVGSGDSSTAFTDNSAANWSTNQSDTFVFVVDENNSLEERINISWVPNANGGSTTVTLTLNGATYRDVVIYEVANINTVDATNFDSSNTANPNTGTVVTSAAALIISAMQRHAGSGVTPPTGYTERYDDDDWSDSGLRVADKIEAASGTFSPTWTATAASWYGVTAAFKQ